MTFHDGILFRSVVHFSFVEDTTQIKGETINYNENFNWEGLQGRLGFGPFGK